MNAELENKASKSVKTTESKADKQEIKINDKSGKVRLGADNDEYWDENVTPLKSDKNMVQKALDKKKMSNVLKEYNDLFVESKILERIIPRKINDAKELRQFSQYILKEEKDYDESDIEGINDVSILHFINDINNLSI